MEEQATYVSVWDGGVAVRSKCTYNRETGIVSDIECVDVDVDSLEDEYIELSDGTQIHDFINEDD
jgi:hypothetical protein